jgi:hypothetical protein
MISGLATEICLWKDGKECSGCNLDKKLFCQPTWKYRLYFSTAFIPMVIAGIFLGFSNLSLTFKLISIVGYIVYMIFFLNVWESHTICNHCPYYANDEEKILNCPIDKGKLKTGKYDPGPLSKSEKIQFIVGFGLFIGIPIPFLIIAQEFLGLVLFFGSFILWVIIIQLKVCVACVNFSCPLNRVNTTIPDKFIKRNPVIRKAWEEKGFQFE